ncbi:MAG: LysR family transcriptional regulator [Pseudoruegeria sp.]
MDTITGMRVFAAVATHRSFTDGAKRAGVSAKLASKYVGQLEERLDAQLFHRTTRTVNLTETGTVYLERCVPLLEQFDELEGLVQATQSELAGRIRITAPTGFGSAQLVHLLQPFQHAHPKVAIDLHLSDQTVSVVDEGYDLAIRFGVQKDSSLVARKLMDMRIVCCASPDYLETHGTPKEPAALATHNCLIQNRSTTTDHWEFKDQTGQISIPVTGNFRANLRLRSPIWRRMAWGSGGCRFTQRRPFLSRRD